MFVNFKRMLLALYRLEEGQQDILARLDKLERPKQEPPKRGPRQSGCFVGERTSDEVSKPCCLRQGEGCAVREDEWLQSGIDSILSFQVSKKKGADQ